MNLVRPDVIEALAAINAAHDRIEKACVAARVAAREYEDAVSNADNLQKAFDDLVQYLHENAPEGTTWHRRYDCGS